MSKVKVWVWKNYSNGEFVEVGSKEFDEFEWWKKEQYFIEILREHGKNNIGEFFVRILEEGNNNHVLIYHNGFKRNKYDGIFSPHLDKIFKMFGMEVRDKFIGLRFDGNHIYVFNTSDMSEVNKMLYRLRKRVK